MITIMSVEQKLSQKDETSTVNGGFIHIIIPSGTPGVFLSRRISYNNLVLALTSRLNALENNLGNYATTKYANRNANFTHSITANQKLECIDVRASAGSPVVAVGTTLGGGEILESSDITPGTDLNAIISKSFPSNTTLYISVSGGYVNITLTIRNEIL